MSLPRLALSLAPLLAPIVMLSAAQPASGAPASAGAVPVAASAPAGAPRPTARPHVTVIEDEQVRIEEARNRDGVSRITVQSKLPGVRSYEIQPPTPGRDPSQEKGNAGRRSWSVLSF